MQVGQGHGFEETLLRAFHFLELSHDFREATKEVEALDTFRGTRVNPGSGAFQLCYAMARMEGPACTGSSPAAILLHRPHV